MTRKRRATKVSSSLSFRQKAEVTAEKERELQRKVDQSEKETEGREKKKGADAIARAT